MCNLLDSFVKITCISRFCDVTGYSEERTSTIISQVLANQGAKYTPQDWGLTVKEFAEKNGINPAGLCAAAFPDTPSAVLDDLLYGIITDGLM